MNTNTKSDLPDSEEIDRRLAAAGIDSGHITTRDELNLALAASVPEYLAAAEAGGYKAQAEASIEAMGGVVESIVEAMRKNGIDGDELAEAINNIMPSVTEFSRAVAKTAVAKHRHAQ